MDRRAFTVGIGIAVFARESAVAQNDAKIYRIGFVEAGSFAANRPFLDAFKNGLRELGYIEGANVIVDSRWADGRTEGFHKALADLIELRPDVIVVSSGLGALEAKRETESIPIVFIGAADPIGLGLVQTLAHPGGNATGLALNAGKGLIGKTLQLLTEIAPGITRLAILWNSSTLTSANRERLTEAQDAARTLTLIPLPIEVRDRNGFAPAFAAMRAQGANALFVVTDPLTLANRSVIVKLASLNRIPAAYDFSEFARSGGLLAYSPSSEAAFRQAAGYVDKIFHGQKPRDLPVQQPTKFELTINVQAAKSLDLTIPQSLLLRADEVIQ